MNKKAKGPHVVQCILQYYIHSSGLFSTIEIDGGGGGGGATPPPPNPASTVLEAEQWGSI